MPRSATGAESYSPALARWLAGSELPAENVARARSFHAELAASRDVLASGDPVNGRLCRLFSVVAQTDLERDLLALLIAFDVSPQVASAVRSMSLWPESAGLERSFLQGVLDPFGEPGPQVDVAQLLRAGHGLSRRGVIRGLREATASRAVFVDLSPIVMTWLVDGTAQASKRADAMTWAPPDAPELERMAGLSVVADADLGAFIERLEASSTLRVKSPRGLDVLLTARLAARRCSRGVIVADLSSTTTDPAAGTAQRAVREGALLAVLSDSWLLVRGLEHESQLQRLEPDALADAVREAATWTLLEDAAPSDLPGLGAQVSQRLDAGVVEVSFPERDSRQQAWVQLLDDQAPDVAKRLSVFPLGFEQIAQVASRQALGIDAVEEGCRQSIGHRVGQLARRVTSSLTWDDVILPDVIVDVVTEMLAYAKHREHVFRDWGFASKHAYGIGLSALFSGPPGTGKTMLSGLVARELGLDLYQIDLSRVVSKYIGETEERLARLFEEAQRGGVALLFDEADSLFAKRTSVKSSTDRYANLEVNFLLQKMEEFSGVAILTTNLESSLDEAFRRRIRFHVKFERPDAEERDRLWRAMLPSSAPVAAGVNFAALAKAYEFSGGEIKNASLRAAFLAVAEGKGIDLDILDRAAAAESAERGRLVRRSAYDFITDDDGFED